MRADSIMHTSTHRLRNMYRTISPRRTDSGSPKLSCRFQTQSFGAPSSISSKRSPAPRISKSRGPDISEASMIAARSATTAPATPLHKGRRQQLPQPTLPPPLNGAPPRRHAFKIRDAGKRAHPSRKSRWRLSALAGRVRKASGHIAAPQHVFF
jgi:hypothetical protein